MADLNIDSLKLEIASDSQSADQSIENLVASLKGLKSTTESTAGSLTKLTNMLAKVSNITGLSNLSNDIVGFANSLKHLNGVDVKANGVSSFTNALARLGKTNTSTLASDMNSIAHSITNVGNATTKQNGINSFVNSLIRFSKVKVDTSTFSDLASTINEIGNTSENGVNAIKSLNSFIRSAEKMKDAAGAFPELSAEIRDFYDSLSSISISDNTVRLAEALAQISQNGGRASTAMNNMTGSLNQSSTAFKVAKVTVDSVGNGFKLLITTLRNVGSAIGTIQKKLGSGIVEGIGSLVSKVKELTSHAPKVDTLTFSFKQLLMTLIGFRGLTGVFNWAKEALTLGGDITEIDHIVESVFSENMVGYVEDWANSAIENFGIAAGAAKRYAGTLTAMFQSNNIAMDDAGRMSMRLVELAGDLSAFYNIDTETAYNKIKSGMAGMVRPLRDLGIDLSAATLKEYALAQGIEKNYSEMTQGEKIMLRYKYILEQTETQQSDFQRTSESFANSLRTLRAYLSSVTTQIGVGLAAAIRPAIVALNHLMKYIVAASKAFATFMQTIFGKYKGGASGMAIDASQYEDASDYASDLADGTEDAASGLSDADEAAKKLKKDLSVLPFDELNQLTKDKTTKSKDDDNGGGAGIDLGDLGDFGEGLLGFATDEVKGKLGELETFMSNWGARIKAAFDAKNWVGLGRAMAWGINKGIDELYKILDPAVAKAKIVPFLNAFTTAFNSLVDAIEWEKLGKAIGNGINILTASANRILDPKTGINWENIGTKLAEGANGMLSTINFTSLGELFANKLNVFWKAAKGFVTNFNWRLLGKNLADGATGLVNQIDYDAIIDTVTEGLRGLATAVSTFAKDFEWAKYGVLFAEKANKLVDQLPVSEILQAILDLTGGIGTTLMKLFDPKEGIDFEKFGHRLAASIKRAIRIKVKPDAIGELLGNIWSSAWELLISFTETLGTTSVKGKSIGSAIHDALASAVSTARKRLGDGTKLGQALGGLAKKFCENVVDAVGDEKLWSDIGESVGNAVGGALGTEGLGKNAADAVNAISHGILAMFRSAIDEMGNDKNAISQNVVDFIKGVDWGAILTMAAPFIGASLIAGLSGLGFNALKTALTLKIAGMLASIGTSTEVVSASTSIFAGLKESLIGPAGILPALILVTDAASNLYDALRGGNGQKSEFGGAVDSLLNELAGIGQITPDVRQELFLLKEEVENGRVSSEEFGKKLSKALQDSGMSAEEAQGVIQSLGERIGGLNENQISVLLGLIGSMPQTTGEAKEALETMGKTGEQAYGDISQALFNYSQNRQGMTLEEGQQLRELLAKYQSTGTGLTTALQCVVNKWVEMGGKPEQIQTAIDTYMGDGAYDAFITASETASSKVGGYLGSMETKTSSVSTALGTLAEDAKQIPADIATGVTNTQGMPTEIIKKMSGEMLATMTRPHGGSNNEFEEESKEIPKGAATGVDNMTWRAVGSVNTMATEMVDKFKDALRINSPSEEFSDMAENIPKGAEQGITKGQSNAVNAINKLVSALISEFKTKISDLKPAMESSTKEAVGSISDALNDKKDDITDAADDIISAVRKVYKKIDGMQDAMWNAGHNAIQSLANGIKSVNIKMPHIYSNGTYRMWTGPNDYWDIPTYDVEWYAKGSLFTNPSVIGVGEAGTEGVIPLENQKAMGMIADAIVNNSNGSLGIDEQTLVDAVAQGYVRAMMSNAGNQKDPIFHIVCKTESDEVLFRAVQRGKDSIEYRNNPTASYGF